MITRLLFKPALASLLVVSLSACGDKGDDTATDGTSTTVTPPGTTTMEPEPTTTNDDTTGPVDPSTTTTGPDPSGTTTTTSDDTTTTTTTTDPGACAAPADDADEDGDGVINSDDNCRCDANPNQLDFDSNSVGNVCDVPLKFAVADGAPPEFNDLKTTASAGMSILQCEFEVDLIVVNGDVQVTLDDTGTAKLWSAKLNFADTPELECNLGIVNVKLRIEDFFADGPDMFVVGFPFTIDDHAAGVITGATDSPHSILVSGVINVTESSNPDLAMPGENPIDMVPGAFPTGQATVSNPDAQVALAFADTDSIIFMQTTDSGIEIKLTGLNGTMRLRKP